MYYFAYGLNMSKRQMREVCPGAKPAFTAVLPNYRLTFTGWERKWRGGVASIRPQRNARVLGAVYEISEKDLGTLDRHEGYPTASDRLKVWVVPKEGDQVEAVAHAKREQADQTEPSPLYLSALRKGFDEWDS